MLIDPKEVIRRLGPDELNRTADAYFASISDPGFHLAKPFSGTRDTAPTVHNLGVLLGGMQLGAGMTVLELGAGSCWLSRLLIQMKCAAISCDVSVAALALGKRLFEEHPPVGTDLPSPRFLPYDGRHIDLPNESVDRVICFDAFHHVPNRPEVLAELARVLKPGGLAGFSEPGPQHSRSAQSQMEMAHFNVLENDVDLDEIFAEAKLAGFSDATFFPRCELMLPVSAYRELVEGRPSPELAQRILDNVVASQVNKTVFFLLKGETSFDSRAIEGLAGRVDPEATTLTLVTGQRIEIRCLVHNTGQARWLSATPNHHGEVQLGAHLYGLDGSLKTMDFTPRQRLAADVPAGASVPMSLHLVAPAPGRYRVMLDLVSEFVCWFGEIGSVRPVLELEVLPA